MRLSGPHDEKPFHGRKFAIGPRGHLLDPVMALDGNPWDILIFFPQHFSEWIFQAGGFVINSGKFQKTTSVLSIDFRLRIISKELR